MGKRARWFEVSRANGRDRMKEERGARDEKGCQGARLNNAGFLE